VVIAANSDLTFDLRNLRAAGLGLLRFDFGLYSQINTEDVLTYPYLPGYLPWLSLAAQSGVHFNTVGRGVPIVSDLIVAWLVGSSVRARGAKTHTVAAAVGLIALSPPFIVSSAVEGQIDSVAVLPAILAIRRAQWTPGARARSIGLLTGAGIAIKSFPILVVLAVFPSLHSARQRLFLVGWSALIPAILLAPFILRDPTGVTTALGYRGYPGGGGLSVVVQPSLWDNPSGVWSEATRLSQMAAPALTAVGVVASNAALWRSEPLVRLCAAVLVVSLVGFNWYLQYAVWILPFLLMAGFLRASFLVQVAMLVYVAPYVLPMWPQAAESYELVDAELTAGGTLCVLGVWGYLLVRLLASHGSTSTSKDV
jgi:hypothetical protein